MGKGKIVEAIGEGQFTLDYQYNVEFIEFEIARLQLRQTDIETDILPTAEADLAQKEEAVSARAEEMNNLIKNLNGEVSPEVVSKLQSAVTALDAAESTLDTTGLRLVSASLALNNSVAAFPTTPPVEVTTAYNAAFAAITLATFSLGDEETSLDGAQSHAGNALSAAQASTPDADAVRAAIQQARDALQSVLADSAEATGDIATAASAVQSAGGSLPGDPSWDLARAHAESAVFAITNSDTGLGGLGAQPLHNQVGALYSQANAALVDAADLMTPGKDSTGKAITDALKKLHEASTAAALARLTIDQLDLELANIETRLDELEAIPKEKRGPFWCADYTTDIDADREIGTCEVPGEYGKIGEVVIRPGFRDAALDWNQTRDGYITPVQALSSAGTFYNLAMLPGWQVYKPTFRFGTITKLNDDETIDVELIAPKISSQQSIEVTPRPIPGEFEEEEPPSTTLKNVEVEYMDCNKEAFLVGDEVLVEYQDQKAEKPRVIGFRKEPRPCGLRFLTPSDALTVKKSGTEWSRSSSTGKSYGNMSWVGEDEKGKTRAVTWKGYRSRYFRSYQSDDPFGPEIYHRGQQIGTAPGNVLGAAIHGKTLLVICQVDATRDALFVRKLTQTADPWVEKATYFVSDEDTTFPKQTPDPWFFNTSATAAASSRAVYTNPIFRKTVTLSIDFDEDDNVTSATFNVPSGTNAIDDEDNSSSDDTCGAVVLPQDCERHITTDTKRTYHNWAVDYFGATLVEIQRIHKVDAQFDGVYGPPFLDCSVGGGPTSSWSETETEHRVTRLVCEAVELDISIYDREGGYTTTGSGFGVPAEENELGCVPYQQQDISQSFTQVGQLLEYLNVTGGTNKVVSLTRDANLTFANTYHFYGPSFGPPVEGFPRDEWSTTTISGPLDLVLAGANPEVTIDTEEVNESTSFVYPAEGTASDGYDEANNMFNLDAQALIKMSFVAADRTGHALASSEKFMKTGGNPVLPETVLEGDPEQFVAVGIA